MATSHQRTQRRADPSGASFISVNTSFPAVGVVVPNTLTHDDSARRRAADLDAEAAYYRHRAIQEEQALGPGYYVDLLRDMATDRAAMAQRIRTVKRSDTTSAPGEAARRRRRQPTSPLHLIAPHRDLAEQTELGPRPNDQRAGEGGAHPHQRHPHRETGKTTP
jgi:hypothetical protein